MSARKIEELVQHALRNDARRGASGPRARRAFEQAMAALRRAFERKIRYHSQRMRLADFPDEVRQAADLAIFDALADYDPAQAAFVTHFGWKLMAQLQTLNRTLFEHSTVDGRARRLDHAPLPTDSFDEEGDTPAAALVDADAEAAIEAVTDARLAREHLRTLFAIFERRTVEAIPQLLADSPKAATAALEESARAIAGTMRRCLEMVALEDRQLAEATAALDLPADRARHIVDFMQAELADIASARQAGAADAGTSRAQLRELKSIAKSLHRRAGRAGWMAQLPA